MDTDYILVENVPFGIALHKAQFENGVPVDFEFLKVNKLFEEITGISREQIVGKYISETFPTLLRENKDSFIFNYSEMLLKGETREFEVYLREINKHYKIRFDRVKDDVFASYVLDITAEVKHKELYKMVLLSINDGVIAINLDFTISLINKSAEAMIGTTWKDARKENLSQVVRLFEANGKPFYLKDAINSTSIIDANTLTNYQILNNTSGKMTPVELSVVPITHCGINHGYVINLKDLSERILNDKKIFFMTYHDSLTGLYNRTYFNEKTPDFEKEENLPLSLIMGDVNGLKLTNDAFGHLSGNELIKAAAMAIESGCRKSDCVIRWGGDEFIVLLPNTDGKEAELICKSIQEQTKLQKIEFLELSISLGFATKHTPNDDLNVILKTAEDMMYDVKLLESKSVKSKTLKLITQTLYERSKEESQHSENVSRLCGLLGRALGLDESMISELIILGKVHDIGKIGINQNILIKDEKLSGSDWQEVKRHSEIGYHILVSSNEMAKIAGYVLAHHEHYDGKGYPKGLKAEEIPLQSRILSISDAYDSMISARPYRKTKTIKQAKAELIRCSGTQFDSEIVDAFIEKVLDNEDYSKVN